jgi:hypothetical protein
MTTFAPITPTGYCVLRATVVPGMVYSRLVLTDGTRLITPDQGVNLRLTGPAADAEAKAMADALVAAVNAWFGKTVPPTIITVLQPDPAKPSSLQAEYTANPTCKLANTTDAAAVLAAVTALNTYLAGKAV